MEKKLQSEIASWLRDQGVYTIVTRVLPGVPVGCPDVIGLYLDRHLEIEVKASEKAPYRPGQAATLERLRKGNKFVYKVYPENWPDVKREIVAHFL